MTDSPQDIDRGKLFVESWRRAGPELEKQREADIRAADTLRASRSFEGSVLWTNRRLPERTSSGLVELCRLLAKGGKP